MFCYRFINRQLTLPVLIYRTMQRNDVNGNAMDNFSYTYQTDKNRLVSVTNSVTSSTSNYSYDNNGNVVTDQMRGVSNVVYNTKNLPEQLTTTNGTVNYSYDGSGNRIKKQQGDVVELYLLGADGNTEAVFNSDGSIKFFNIIAGSEVIGRYEPSIDSLNLTNRSLNRTYRAKKINAEINVTVPVSAKFKVGTRAYLKPGFTTAAGSNFEAKVDAGVLNPARYYYLKDHLGSVRVTVDQTGEVVSFDDYDAWGMQLSGRSNNLASEVEKYKYVGNERDEETGYDYLGHRYYDSRIGGLLSVDPFAHKDPSRSPYSYAANNPILFYDEKGDSVSIITSGPTYTNTPSAISTPGSLVGHTAINIDGKVYSFDGTGHWSVKSYNDYISNEKQVRSVIEQTVDVDQSKVQVAVNNREDGKYNVENNSCVTNTMNFLSAGGMQFNKPNGAVTPEQLSNSLQNSGFVSNAQRSVSLSSPAIIGLMTYRAAELLMNSGIWNPLGVKLNTVPLLLGK
jgi:RHS repeat-associated protein